MVSFSSPVMLSPVICSVPAFHCCSATLAKQAVDSLPARLPFPHRVDWPQEHEDIERQIIAERPEHQQFDRDEDRDRPPEAKLARQIKAQDEAGDVAE